MQFQMDTLGAMQNCYLMRLQYILLLPNNFDRANVTNNAGNKKRGLVVIDTVFNIVHISLLME